MKKAPLIPLVVYFAAVAAAASASAEAEAVEEKLGFEA